MSEEHSRYESSEETLFEEWWKSYWTRQLSPEVMNLVFKEVAENAWKAARRISIEENTHA